MTVRIVVVGTGHMGRHHALKVAELRDAGGADFAGILDLDPERARGVAAETGTRAVADARELFCGADAAIRRAGTIAAGACVVKVARLRQDPRFDLPAIGLETARVLVAAGAAALAFEAGRTIVLDRDALVATADAHGIALVGVSGEGLARSAP